MTTLIEALKDLIETGEQDRVALDDGAQNWYAEALKDEISEEEAETEVYYCDQGIFFFDNNGYINELSGYKFRHGSWETGDFEENEQDNYFI